MPLQILILSMNQRAVSGHLFPIKLYAKVERYPSQGQEYRHLDKRANSGGQGLLRVDAIESNRDCNRQFLGKAPASNEFNRYREAQETYEVIA